MPHRWKDLKLRNKLVISMALISALMTGAALAAVRLVVRGHIEYDVQDQLRNSVMTFQDFQRRSEAFSERAATLLANLPSLKAVMTTNDPATIQDASAEISRIGNGGLFVLADRAGRVVGLHPATGAIDRDTAQKLFRDSLRHGASRAWWYGNGHLYEVFLHPIALGMPDNRDVIGVLAFGQQIDQSIASQIGDVAAGDVVFAYNGKPVVSTLPASQRHLFEEMRLTAGSQATIRDVKLGKEQFAAVTVPLDPEKPGLTLTVLKSYDRATRFLQTLNRLIVGVGLGVLLIGVGLVFLISRAFLRPLSTLVTGTQALEQGDYEFPLIDNSHDEAGQLTAAFNRMRATLRQTQQGMVRAARMEALGQLASGVAHDFNNIITVINGFSELLLHKLQAGDDNRRYAEEIRNAGSRAAGLTRQLLIFSRQQPARTQVVDVNSAIANMTKMLRMLVGLNIELEFLQETPSARIEIDPTHIEQVVMNLAANARDAMPGGGKLTIAVSHANLEETFTSQTQNLKPGPHVMLSVRDSGSGMDLETQRHIFEPFFTTKEAGKGTGLGLATVYGIIRQHGGHIAVVSAPGEGTTFNLYFPALGADAAIPVTHENPIGTRPGSETILLVEDDDALRALEQETLESHGYTVLPAGDGVEAMELIHARPAPVDLVVTDIEMPRMGGRDLMAALLQKRPGLRVVYTSGNIHRAAGIANDGNVWFLEKPFTPAELILKLQEVLSVEKQAAPAVEA